MSPAARQKLTAVLTEGWLTTEFGLLAARLEVFPKQAVLLLLLLLLL